MTTRSREAYVFTEGRTEALVNGVELTLDPGDVLWTGSGCGPCFYNRTAGRVRWFETQSPQPPSQHSYRFNRDWGTCTTSCAPASGSSRTGRWR